MPLIFRYFWFISAAVMLLNIAIWRRRLRAVVSRGMATQAEVDQFLRGAAAALIGGPLLLGLIALIAGWSSPFCAGTFAFDTPPRALTSGVIVGAWLALLLWVWRGKGADLLSRVGPALSKRPEYDRTYSLMNVRLVVTVVVLASAAGAFFNGRSTPHTPDVACPAALPAS